MNQKFFHFGAMCAPSLVPHVTLFGVDRGEIFQFSASSCSCFRFQTKRIYQMKSAVSKLGSNGICGVPRRITVEEMF